MLLHELSKRRRCLREMVTSRRITNDTFKNMCADNDRTCVWLVFGICCDNNLVRVWMPPTRYFDINSGAYMAAKFNRLEVLKMFYDHYKKTKQVDKYLWGAVSVTSSKERMYEIVRICHKYGARGSWGTVIAAAKYDRIDVVQFLEQFHPDLTQRVVLSAAYAGSTNVFKHYIPLCSEDDREEAFTLALSQNHTEILRLLRNPSRRFILRLGKFGAPETVKFCLDRWGAKGATSGKRRWWRCSVATDPRGGSSGRGFAKCAGARGRGK